MAQSKAWILDLNDEDCVAIGNQQMVEYILASDVKIMPLPLTPAYSLGVLAWREQMIPVIDIGRLLSNPGAELPAMTGVMVLAYQQAPGEPIEHGAIVLRSAPRDITVNSDMSCPLPIASAAWKTLAIACFSDQGHEIPVLNAKQVFSSAIHKVYEELADSQNSVLADTLIESTMQPSAIDSSAHGMYSANENTSADSNVESSNINQTIITPKVQDISGGESGQT
jgi:chemotaxis signal transduction protein